MSGDDFDAVFNQRVPNRPGFAERVGQSQVRGDRQDAIAAMAFDATNPTPEIYKPFGFVAAGSINHSCEVRTWMDGTDVPDGVVFFYRLLMQIGFTGDTQLRLMFPDTIIVLTGKHLNPLRQALTRQHATYIQRYSRKVWPEPVPEGDTFIERIEILRSSSMGAR